MGKSAAIAACCGFESNSVGFLNPFFDTDLVAVQSGLVFNYGEFAIIKSGIEHRFPDAEELDGVPIAEPVGDPGARLLAFGGFGGHGKQLDRFAGSFHGFLFVCLGGA
jgi:hypothetical protein